MSKVILSKLKSAGSGLFEVTALFLLTMNRDHLYMLRALELAQLGSGAVSPNPMVGCVIVYQDKVIGEGWHKIYGSPHAEVNAINAVKDPSLLPESEVFVSLEPCSHFGKTPPCVDLLIKHKVKRVVICNDDPNPLVSGKGMAKLKDAGIEVSCGLLKEKGLELNKRFFTFFIKKRPYIILKWAETADGYIARENGDSKWISGLLSRTLVHKWRAEEDSIMVGRNTAEKDNPELNVRLWTGNNPLRLVIDRNLLLPDTLHVFDKSQPTIVYNINERKSLENLELVQCNSERFFEDIMDDLYGRRKLSIIVEGGAKVLNAMIALDMWDEARVFTSQSTFGAGIPAPALRNAVFVERENVDNDLLSIFAHSNPWQKN